jgi:large conductance mechanosensitive channel
VVISLSDDNREGRAMFHEFKAFIAKGNVLDLAVAVIIGAAFGAIVTSLTGDIIMPVIGAVFGGADLSNHFILLSVPAGYEGSTSDYAALKDAGAAMIGYGAFLTAVINFVILAFVIFLMVKQVNRLKRSAPPPAPPVTPEDVLLLREIRDSLKK